MTDDVIPIARFKSQAKAWLEEIAATGRTIVLTQNGVPAGVLLSPAEYDRIRERHRFLEGVAAGIHDAESGRVLTTEALRARLGKGNKSR